jgi:hypothetical protein
MLADIDLVDDVSISVIRGSVCVPGKERYKPVVYGYWEVQFSHLVQ